MKKTGDQKPYRPMPAPKGIPVFLWYTDALMIRPGPFSASYTRNSLGQWVSEHGVPLVDSTRPEVGPGAPVIVGWSERRPRGCR